MNTDKLMEMERKWRAEAAKMSTYWKHATERCADELAAALRAEQAVGDEQRAHIETLRAVRSVFEGIPAPCAERDAIDAAIRALGTARQSEGVVPNEAVPITEGGALLPMVQSGDWIIPHKFGGRVVDARMAYGWNECRKEMLELLAAAPGGEGEG